MNLSFPVAYMCTCVLRPLVSEADQKLLVFLHLPRVHRASRYDHHAQSCDIRCPDRS